MSSTKLTKKLIATLLINSAHVIRSFPLLRRDFINTAATTTIMSATTTSNIKDPIHWGIVGLGDVTEKKSGPPFWKCDGSQLVAAMRRTPGKAQEFAQKVPGGKCVGYENLDEFLEHPGLQAVYVCTRPGTHLEIGKKVAAAGKACYVEKPVGRCAAETQELKDIFEEKNLPFYTAYISRAYGRTQAVKKILEEGTIGKKIQKVSYSLVGTGGARDMEGSLPWRLNPEQSGGGLIMDVGCHVIDRIDYLCGPLINVKGKAENRNSPKIPVEDFVSFTAEVGQSPGVEKSYGVGAKVECAWDFASQGESKDELVFWGEKGSISLAGMLPDGPISVRDVQGNEIEKLTFEMPEHTAQLLIQATTDDLRGLPRKDCVSVGENAVRASKVIDSVLESYYGGREFGYWNRPESWPGKPTTNTSA